MIIDQERLVDGFRGLVGMDGSRDPSQIAEGAASYAENCTFRAPAVLERVWVFLKSELLIGDRQRQSLVGSRDLTSGSKTVFRDQD